MPGWTEHDAADCHVRISPSSIDMVDGAGDPLSRLAPQQRAVRAVRDGLALRTPGTNVAIVGPQGTGRTFLATALAAEEARRRRAPDDVVLLPNPHGPLEPRPVPVPTGSAPRLVRAMETLHARLVAALHEVLEGNERNRIVIEVQQTESRRRKQIRRKVDQLAASYGLALVETDRGFEFVPLDDERPQADDGGTETPDPSDSAQLELPGLPDDTGPTDAQRRYLLAVEALRPHIEAMQRDLALVETEAAAELVARQRAALRNHFDAAFDALPGEVLSTDRVRDHVRALREHLMEHYRLQEDDTLPIPSDAIEEGLIVPTVLTSSPPDSGAPIVHARNPTLSRLFGRMVAGPEETRYPPPGTILPGDLHKANGGFLLVDAESIVARPRVYEHLKNCLIAGQILPLEEGEGQLLRPQPLDLEVKVVLIADPELLARLAELDPAFGHLFKVRAEFVHDMSLEEACSVYPRFCAWLSDNRNLPPCTPEAVAALVAHGARLAEDRNRATAELGRLENVVVEAAQYVTDGDAIRARHVEEAIERMRERDARLREDIVDAHVRRRIACAVSGGRVGQVNGLGVVTNGFVRVGRPLRVSAVTFAGDEGTLAIDREVELSGPIHDKGVLVLSSFLAAVFAQHEPLSLCASIVFEQSYDIVDGDSASVAELVAILSSLSGIPVRQDVAVTGSLDQYGSILAVGGVVEKIEGFFDVCRALGPEPSQGVLVPAANRDQLVLRPDVLQAIEEGTFHVWSAERVEDAIEFMLGVPAGFPATAVTEARRTSAKVTVYGRVMERIAALREGRDPPKPRKFRSVRGGSNRRGSSRRGHAES